MTYFKSRYMKIYTLIRNTRHIQYKKQSMNIYNYFLNFFLNFLQFLFFMDLQIKIYKYTQKKKKQIEDGKGKERERARIVIGKLYASILIGNYY